MYDPAITEEQESLLLRSGYQHAFPRGVPKYSVDDARALSAQVNLLFDPESGTQLRPYTPEENDFVAAAKFRVLYDAIFFLQVFVNIDEEGHGLRPLYPLWESQTFVLDRLAAMERKQKASHSPDGLLLNVLKARQLGISTLAEALVSHRILTRPFIRAICGSDVEEQAVYLFRMVERIYDQLPHFLKPAREVPYKSGREIHFSNKSGLKSAWGKTTRGALQEAGGKKGNIERGRTNSVVHISELATWDNPDQLDTALLPGIPLAHDTLVIFESTAELADDWWHKHWLTSGRGMGRFSNIFIPWCIEPGKYSLPAPTDWTPAEETLGVATAIERDVPQWLGRPFTLTRDQLYWYEQTRLYFVQKGRLYDFLKEFPSNAEETFQYAGRSVFTLDEMARIDQSARKLLDVWTVEPARDIAELRRLPPDDESKQDQEVADKRRYPVPMATKVPAREAEVFSVPPGYGFRRLTAPELKDLLADPTQQGLRQSVLAIWEYPRLRSRRRYILGVDVGDGLGLDYSVVTVVREPTIEEPAEEVAQYVSNRVKPSQLAYIVDAIGHLYCDEDGIEAVAAVELNNHGASVQDLLQLHLGYSNFYVWEVVDAADPSARYTKRIGWQTTSRTRPILIEKFHDAVTTLDPISNLADFRLNSPTTRGELRHFITENLLGEAEHARGHHDDAIFSAGISYYVAHRLAGGETEPIAERRRRRAQLKVLAESDGRRYDWRNSAASAEAANAGEDDDLPDDLADRDTETYFH